MGTMATQNRMEEYTSFISRCYSSPTQKRLFDQRTSPIELLHAYWYSHSSHYSTAVSLLDSRAEDKLCGVSHAKLGS